MFEPNHVVARLQIEHLCDGTPHGTWRMSSHEYTIHRLVTGELRIYRHEDYSEPTREFERIREFFRSEEDGQWLRKVLRNLRPLRLDVLDRTRIQFRSEYDHPGRNCYFFGGQLDKSMLF